MYLLLLSIACLSLTGRATEFERFFEDEPAYNPCEEGSGIYFYPDPTDPHQYYQCDESGTAYSRSCGTLVWDEIRTACNWPAVVAPRFPSNISSTTTAPPAPSPWTTLRQPSSTTSTASASLCEPVNPCGEHGQCVESLRSVRAANIRFACICNEDWFGRLCDKQIDELTTPDPSFDQPNNGSETASVFSLPVFNEKDTKTIFYGLQGNNAVEHPQEVRTRMIDPKVSEEQLDRHRPKYERQTGESG